MPVASLTSSVTSAVASHGVWAVFALMLVDAVFPAASELVMVYAGALGGGAFAGVRLGLFGHAFTAGWQGYIAASLAGTLGYTAGALLGWWIGFHAGRPFVERRGGLLHVTPERLAQADRWFADRGDATVLFGRLTPVVRSFISIPAGAARMPLRRYVPLTLIGSAVWAFGLAGIGWGVGKGYRHFHSTFDLATVAVAAAILLVGVALVLRRRRLGTAR